MKLLLSALLLTTSCSIPVLAQTPDWLWAHSGVGEEFDQANTVTTDPSGNVIVAGYFASDSITFGDITLQNNTPGFDDLFIVKYDAAGNVLWAQAAGGNFDDKAYAVGTDAAGNIYLTGDFYSTSITFSTYELVNAGNVGDIFLVKYSPAGNVLWALREGGPGLEIPYAIALDNVGNCVVAGRFSSNSITFGTTTLTQSGSMDVFVVKYDPTGQLYWATGAGGGSNDEAYALAINSAGDVIVAGYYTQEADFGTFTLPNPGLANIFLAQCDGTTGAFEWAKATSSDGDERALAIDLDAADNIYAAGFFQGESLTFGSTTLLSTATDNGFVARYDADGDPVWAQGLNGRSKAQGIAVHGNAVFACGVFRDGTLNYGPTTLTLAGASDLFLLKSDLNGNAQWAAQQTADGESGESALAMAADATGHLVMAGNFDSDQTTFGPAQLVNSNGYDMFVIRTGDAASGITEGSVAGGLAVWPNPGTGTFVVDGLAGEWSANLYDASGKVVRTVNTRSAATRTELDATGLRPGLYELRVLGPKGARTLRVVLQ